MSILDEAPTTKVFAFHGKGSTYFGIAIVNFILTLCTLGLYYPWAKAARLKYLYGTTEFDGGHFVFHGKGKEMFIGMFKAIGIMILLLSLLYVGSFLHIVWMILIGFLLYMVGFIIILPLAIVGGLRYRLSRSSWKGIHMGYRGSTKKMLGMCIKGSLLTMITFGIYYPWFATKLYKEIAANTRLGSLEAHFKGDGDDLFGIYILGYILCILTLGIYGFWWLAKRYNFVFNNIVLQHEEKKAYVRSKVTGGKVFGLYVMNFLLIIFTLGIAYPWVKMRTANFYLSHIEITGFIDFDKIKQTEGDYANATGDSFLDAMDLQLF